MGIVSETFLQGFARELAKPRPARKEVTAVRWAYRESAAVLTFFQPGNLHPHATAKQSAPDAQIILREDIVSAPGLAPSWFLLKASVRRAALERLGSPVYWRDALAANPDRPTSPFQGLYEIWLSGKPPDLDHQNYEELTWSAQIASWLEGLSPDFPGADVVRTMCQRRSVYALFSHLALESFTGRETELGALRDFVGVLPPDTVSERFFRQIRSWFDLRRRDPLVIEGKGGVGKSALLARLLNEHFKVEEALRFPFSYLAFDSPTLRVEEPFTLLTECARQLQLLQPERTDAFSRYQEAIASYRDQRGDLEEKSHQVTTRGERSGRLRRTEESLGLAFADLVNDLTAPPTVNPDPGMEPTVPTRPFLLVLDTFEEAAYRGQERLIGLFRLMELLHERCATFRLVIFTRPPFVAPKGVELRFKHLALPDLTTAESEILLRKLGVADPAVAKTVADQIGGNPLNLQLAARVLESEQAGSGGIEGVKTKSYFFFSVGTEVVRGQLYARLLDHIHDPRVRSLAHPGMVLRKIDPWLIQKVLSAPCNVPVKDLREAESLCDALAEEHTLVQMDAPRVLRFRPDIRLPVLELLRQDKPKQVRDIHEAAARYYRLMSGPAEQAEAIYHRLALEEEGWQLDQDWRPEYGQYLAPALEEIPPRSQAWLASKLGLDLSPEARKRASLADWEAITGRKVRDTLRYGRPEEALEHLRERPERTSQSVLFAYEAKTLIALSQFDNAQVVLERGVASMQQTPSPGRMAELYWLLSQVAEMRLDRTLADVALAYAESIALDIPDPLTLLQVLLQRVLLRREGNPSGEPIEPIRQRLAQQLRSMSDEDWHRERSLSRTAAMMLGTGYSQLFIDVISAVGFGRAANETIQKLVGANLSSFVADTDLAFPKELMPTLQEVWGGEQSLERLLHEFSSRGYLPALMPVLQRLMDSVPVSLGGANLAGIEDYREVWEKEIAMEAV